MDEKINYWLDIAEYDLATAEAMLKVERRQPCLILCRTSRKLLWRGCCR